MTDALKEVERLARDLYGQAAFEPVRGVLHVVSALETGDKRLHVIKIGPSAPKSETDWFVLNFWRAHCDAILSTAAIVRAEPALSHALQGEHAAGLSLYRQQVLGKQLPPLCAILSHDGSIPSAHPVWDDPLRNYVLTTPTRAGALQRQLGGRVPVVGIADLDPRRALAWLRVQGARVVLIEAGPMTAARFYDDPPAVDHLLLSRCEAPVALAAVGGALPEPTRLFAGLRCATSSARDEASGRWRFERWDRAPSPTPSA